MKSQMRKCIGEVFGRVPSAGASVLMECKCMHHPPDTGIRALIWRVPELHCLGGLRFHYIGMIDSIIGRL